jgi:spore coat protein U-like protein
MRLPSFKFALGLAIIIGAGLEPDLVSAAQVSCSVSATNINFGNVDVLANSNVDTTGTITISCSNGAPPNRITRNCVSIDVGSAGDATSRQLVGPGGAKLRYDLYTDSARTTLWGSWQTGYDTAGATVDVPFNGSSNVTVYARLFASQQTVAVGAYSSSFTANAIATYFYDPGSTGGPSSSSTTSTSFAVSATVITSCNVSATTLKAANQVQWRNSSSTMGRSCEASG